MSIEHRNAKAGPELQTATAALGASLMAQGLTLSVAESCTGGLLGAALTSVPGSSHWFTGGVIAYANEAKMRLLGVDENTLRQHGAVSEETVRQMARGVCRALSTDVGISVSGVAGPGGGTAEKPVGTVWLGFCVRGCESALLLRLAGDREEVRKAAVSYSIDELMHRLTKGEA